MSKKDGLTIYCSHLQHCSRLKTCEKHKKPPQVLLTQSSVDKDEGVLLTFLKLESINEGVTDTTESK